MKGHHENDYAHRCCFEATGQKSLKMQFPLGPMQAFCMHAQH